MTLIPCKPLHYPPSLVRIYGSSNGHRHRIVATRHIRPLHHNKTALLRATKNTLSKISAKRLVDLPVRRSATLRHTSVTHSASELLPRLSFALGSLDGAPRADHRLPPRALGSPHHPRSRLPSGRLGSSANRPITAPPLNNRGTASMASRTVNPRCINTAVPALQNHLSSNEGPDSTSLPAALRLVSPLLSTPLFTNSAEPNTAFLKAIKQTVFLKAS